MRTILLFWVLAGLASLAPAANPAVIRSDSAPAARPLLSPVFGSHMVLQRNKPNTFWGWDAPGTTVTVTLGRQTARAIAGDDGRWSLTIEVPAAGGPHTIRVEGSTTVTLDDVLVGDVWLCSGQSNMEWPLRASIGAEAVLADADQPDLRLYSVPRTVAYTPLAVPRGEWRRSTSETAAGFSAVAYYFARKLNAELDVPVGVIQSAVGGSPAESWMSAEALARAGEFGPQVAEIARIAGTTDTRHGSFLMHWLDEYDVGGRGEAWAKPDFDDSAWRTVTVPGGFTELGVAEAPAIVWFRREFDLPDPLPAGPAKIYFGVVERMDTIYLNGHWTGASSWVENPRIYTVPADALKPGRNVIAVRVFKTKPDGGFMSPAETLRLQLGDGADIPLAGEWRAAVSFHAQPPATLPLDFDNYPTMPTVLYNGMIAPLAPLAITGALWYQGEANSNRAQQYRQLMPALIADWRAKFRQGEFPFYIVGLPAFQPHKTEPGGTDDWSELRAAQAFTVRNTRNTALAVTIDTGEADNIHPRDKQPVGERLARLALAQHYGREMIAQGPTLRFLERRPGSLILHFNHVADGLQLHGDALGEFSVQAEDGTWHWADAKIEDKDKVVLTASGVASPIAARYAWQSNPQATLVNSAGLPAAPFRTDD